MDGISGIHSILQNGLVISHIYLTFWGYMGVPYIKCHTLRLWFTALFTPNLTSDTNWLWSSFHISFPKWVWSFTLVSHLYLAYIHRCSKCHVILLLKNSTLFLVCISYCAIIWQIESGAYLNTNPGIDVKALKRAVTKSVQVWYLGWSIHLWRIYQV